MATQIAEAYVQIKPSMQGIKNELKSQMGGELDKAGNDAGKSFGSSLISALKGIIAAAGIGTIVKQALDAGGALQQSFGGLDTLYGDASQAAKNYAKEAAAAGISMNDYAEQAVSFGASLKQAFEGDVVKAAEAANTAILDMADNSAKMGTDIQSVQSAYQGFAKQNYTMLDNLKLGYGGTKTEMERLLKDAEKLPGAMGKAFDINNLGDVYEAIHLIQEDLGLTGVAAQEASETFTGSFGAMKAAATNLLADITIGNMDGIYDDIQNLFQTAETFIFNNLTPMVANLVSRLPQLVANLLYELGDLLKNGASQANIGVDFIVQLFVNMAEAIVENLPYLLEGFVSMAIAIGDALIHYDWIGTAQNMIKSFKGSINDAMSDIFGSDTNLLATLKNWIVNTLPQMVESGMQVITTFVKGAIDKLPEVVAGMSKVVATILETVMKNLPEIIQAGFKVLTSIITGILNCIPNLISALPSVFNAIKNAFSGVDWASLGINIVRGIINGLYSMIGSLVDSAINIARSAFNAAKNALGIHSPSRLFRDEIGAMIPEGMAIGINANVGDVDNAITDMSNSAYNTALDALSYDFGNIEASNSTSANESLNTILNLLGQYLPTMGGNIILDTGVLVGATAGKMDAALGQLSTNAERGVVYA